MRQVARWLREAVEANALRGWVWGERGVTTDPPQRQRADQPQTQQLAVAHLDIEVVDGKAFFASRPPETRAAPGAGHGDHAAVADGAGDRVGAAQQLARADE